MTTMPPPLPVVYDRDADHLKVLSIIWYVVAGLQALGALCILLYMGIGILMTLVGVGVGAAGSHAAHDPSGAVAGLPFVGMGVFVVCLSMVILLFCGTLSFLSFKCGQSLARRRHITLCYVMAALSCLSIPMGTLLGVFTFIVLARPSVRVQFDQSTR